ncbi:MAG: SDR family NAD(P)-dependent oxidoreductase, partial [Polyangiaceae bacterium]|nr:SDR family NAD(P)-dependent oxidoreductase [Polyangiaceae bacterium]
MNASAAFPDTLPSLAGQRAIVTGATSGLGRETARALALAGAEVILAVRDASRGATVAEALRTELGSPSLSVETLDVSDFTSVRAFGERVRARGDAIDIVVHNAGIM